MSDINLTAAVRSNLLSLQTTNMYAARTSNRLSTGLKVSSPVDDAVAYFAAKALNDRADTFDGRKQGIDQAISTLNVAIQATSSVDSILKQMKGLLQSGQANTNNGSQLAQLSSQFLTLATQLNLVIHDAAYQGTNLVGNASINASGGSSVTLSVNFSDMSQSKVDIYANFVGTYGDSVANNGISQAGAGGSVFSVFAGDGSGNTYSTTLSAASLAAYGVVASGGVSANTLMGLLVNNGLSIGFELGLSGVAVLNYSATGATTTSVGTAGIGMSNFTANGFFAAINSVDLAITKNRAVAAVYGSTLALLNTRLDFTKQYVDTLQGGAGKYTLADLNQEGANLTTLQTRQQLGIQSLSFSGQITQSIMRLFQ